MLKANERYININGYISQAKKINFVDKVDKFFNIIDNSHFKISWSRP